MVMQMGRNRGALTLHLYGNFVFMPDFHEIIRENRAAVFKAPSPGSAVTQSIL